ncbi:hybrid sensor histidine kinase/response regulator [Nocardioides dongkuii]|uniref:hybrid sensor histidine kinase/response regulator n=1 Tax=Nocardioides dongkuii TaxID=2760089 RepID=UPI0018786B77|nr:response regulator [Nocardioides dongkuii]
MRHVAALGRLPVAALVAVLVLAVVQVAHPTGLGGELSYFAGLVVAASVAWIGVLRTPPGRRRVSALVAGGISASAAGDAVWSGYVAAGLEPDATWADPVYAVAYLLLGGALVVLLVRGQRGAGIDGLIDAVTVIVVALLLAWHVSIAAIVSDPTYSASERAVLASYPILDAVLLALLGRLLGDRRTRAPGAAWIAGGIGCWLVADVSYLVLVVEGTTSAVVDATFMLGSGLLAMAVFAPDRARPIDGERLATRPATLRRLAISVLPLLVPPVLLAVDASTPGPSGKGWVLAGGGILLALAFVRTARLLESERLARDELVGARDAALTGSRAKSAFLATMSHEIRTPMNGVIGLTGLLLTTDLGDRQRQYAEGVQGAGEQLLAIINDILDFSKVEAGHLELESVDFDVAQLVGQSGELVAAAAQAKGVELLAYCSPDLPLGLRGDPTRLRQVLTNLVGNAVKFTEHGEVVVSARVADDSPGTDDLVLVHFEVRDTGIGIPEGETERLFEPFLQVDSSTTRRYGGTGLGLAIARRLVAAMGGELRVRSTLGEGSTFSFTLPLAAALDPDIAPVPLTRGLERARVLVVDDNQTNRLILQEQTTAWGTRTATVEDAPTALRMLRAAAGAGKPFDIAILDLCMPGMDGLELARLVAEDPDIRLGTVLLTSGPDVSAAEAAAAGIDVRLTKPVHLTRLREALQQVLGRHAAARIDDAEAERPPRGHALVVEDSELNQIVAVGVLTHLGFTADVVGDGRQALDALERTAYDVVLMDCQMPVLDGYDATRELRRRENGARRLPVIALTAGVVQGERERCLAAGMDDYVAKPFTPDDLGAALSRWVPVSA